MKANARYPISRTSDAWIWIIGKSQKDKIRIKPGERGVCEPALSWFDLFRSTDDQCWRRASDRLYAIVRAQCRIRKRQMNFYGTYSKFKPVSDLFHRASFGQQ